MRDREQSGRTRHFFFFHVRMLTIFKVRNTGISDSWGIKMSSV